MKNTFEQQIYEIFGTTDPKELRKWCSLLFIVSFLKKKAMARIVEHIAKVAAVGREKAKSAYRCDK